MQNDSMTLQPDFFSWFPVVGRIVTLNCRWRQIWRAVWDNPKLYRMHWKAKLGLNFNNMKYQNIIKWVGWVGFQENEFATGFQLWKKNKSEYSAPSRGLWDTASQLQLGLPPVVAWRQWQRWKGRWRTLHRYGQMHIDLIGTVSPLRVVSSLQRCLGSNGKHPKMLMATLATYEKRGNSFGFTQTPLWQER